jgi:hypothetical protein
MSEDRDILKGLIAGLAGGLAATWVMTNFQEFWSEAERISTDSGGQKPGQGTPESQQGHEEPATIKTAEAVSQKVLHRQLLDSEKESAGTMVHYATGVGTGLLYGLLTELSPETGAGYGLVYGAAVWGVLDNLAVPAMGLSGWPNQYPAKQNVYGLASHLVYGTALDICKRVVRKALD